MLLSKNIFFNKGCKKMKRCKKKKTEIRNGRKICQNANFENGFDIIQIG